MALAKRYAFAAMVLFFGLANWWFPIGYLPFVDKLADWIGKGLEAIVIPLAAGVFHATADPAPTGSGDTTFNFVQYALFLALAVAGGLAWALAMRSRVKYERTNDVFRVFLRFALAAAMIGYGTIKVIQSQFPPPTLERMVQPFGSASPMGLLWTFMGASRAYNFLTGAAELLGGILLTMRRTTLLGALVSAAAMANIAALNFCYDVPVKLYSTQLLIEALILAAPDFRRLAGVLVLNRTAPPREERPLFRRKGAVTASLVFRTLVVTAFVLLELKQANDNRHQYGDLSPRSPLRGIWEVVELTDNGVARPPLTTDLTRWRRVVFDSPLLAYILSMSDARSRYRIELDEAKRTMKLTDRDNAKSVTTLAYSRPDPRTLVLDGVMGGHTMHAVCRLSDLGAKPLLTTRGFHWINEFPFNR